MWVEVAYNSVGVGYKRGSRFPALLRTVRVVCECLRSQTTIPPTQINRLANSLTLKHTENGGQSL